MTNKVPSISIIVAAHKKYRMPSDDIYIPLHVGAEGKKNKNGTNLDFGYLKDNTGENISEKNSKYCELTGLYWAWKNIDTDYIGLVHYRRYFKGKKRGENVFEKILSHDELNQLLRRYRVIVPKKRNYYIETIYSHYKHTHYIEQLDLARKIIAKYYPDYLISFDKIMKYTSAYMFNMMIMDRLLLNQYCTWLFDILDKIEKKNDMPQLSSFQERYCGRIGELIFNVWLEYQLSHGIIKKNEVKEIPYIYMEKIDWKRKIFSFLKSKFFHKKYERSF